MLHVSKTQSKDARTACKRIIKKEKKRIRNEYIRKFGIRNDAFLSKIR